MPPDLNTRTGKNSRFRHTLRFFREVAENTLDNPRAKCYIKQALIHKAHARVVELADSLDSGSSVHSGRAGSSPASRTMIAEHYRWNGKKASHLNGFGNFLFSKFLGNSIDEITDGRGFEPLLFHIQGIFAVSALFQRAAAAGFQKNRRKIFHKVMGAGLLVFTNQWPVYCPRASHIFFWRLLLYPIIIFVNTIIDCIYKRLRKKDGRSRPKVRIQCAASSQVRS